ncbi:hypothetical protein F4809DRAFT_653369 [Biscogniauxia mediterranea]|nr:hypothetical protein F4809DRAFT_653369 [Biscogniauxia mediterranea]
MPLFHKKSKSSLCSKKSISSSSSSSNSSEDRSFHMRKWSSSSSISQASSNGSHGKPACYDPLSLHPPLTLNTSPHIIPEHDVARYREDEERERRFFNQTRHVEDHIQDMTEYSPVKGKNCCIERPKGRSYLYDQNSQWPLKDWQVVPPGLAQLDATSTAPQGLSPPPLTHQRRNTDWMYESDVFVKRGAWKRRGIVFQLDSEDELLQELHFELPGEE